MSEGLTVSNDPREDIVQVAKVRGRNHSCREENEARYPYPTRIMGRNNGVFTTEI